MGSRFFLLRRRLRKGSRFLRSPRVYCRAATAAFAAAVSLSQGSRLSGRRGTSGLPVGVQHAITLGTHAAEPALPVFFAALKRAHSAPKHRYPGAIPRTLSDGFAEQQLVVPVCKCREGPARVEVSRIQVSVKITEELDAGDFDARRPFPTFANGNHELLLCEAIGQ